MKPLMNLNAWLLFICMCWLTSFSSFATENNSVPGKQMPVVSAFTENKGQVRANETVLYYLRLSGMDVFFGLNKISYVLKKVENHNIFIDSKTEMPEISLKRMDAEWVGTNEGRTKLVVEGQFSHVQHFYMEESKGVFENVRSFSKLTYQDLYPGIDVVFYVNEKGLKYDYILKPGADINSIRIQYKGQKKISLTGDAGLAIEHEWGMINENIPESFLANGSKVDVQYEVQDNMVNMHTKGYDKTQTLTIDPYIPDWGRSYGGGGSEFIWSMQLDAKENSWVSGSTQSVILPGNVTTLVSSNNDGFVACIDKEGQLLFSVAIGGAGDDHAFDVVCNNSLTPTAYVVGHTVWTGSAMSNSTVSWSTSSTPSTGDWNSFITRVGSTGVIPGGGIIYYGTGGLDSEKAFRVAIDNANGVVYMAGNTTSGSNTYTATPNTSFWSTNGSGVFVASYNLQLTTMNWDGIFTNASPSSTQVGAIEIGASGNLYLSGSSNSGTSLPLPAGYTSIPGANGNMDVFVARFNGSGTQYFDALYYGGNGTVMEQANRMVLFPDGNGNENILLTGNTTSSNLPVDNSPTFGGLLTDGFVACFDFNLQNRLLSFYYGGNGSDEIWGLDFDASSNDIYVAGRTGSSNLNFNNFTSFHNPPVALEAFTTRFHINSLAANNGTFSVVDGSYLGGSSGESGFDLALQKNTAPVIIYVTGYTASSNFSPSLTSVAPTLSGGQDGFLLRFCDRPAAPQVAGPLVVCPTQGGLSTISTYSIQNPNSAYSYTWNFPPVQKGVNVISGSTGTTAQIAFDEEFSGTYVFSVAATNYCGTSFTGTTITVSNGRYTAQIDPGGPWCISQGGSVDLTLNLDPNLSTIMNDVEFPIVFFQWYKDGQPYSPQPPNILAPLSVTTPGKYKLAFHDACNNVVFSNEVIINIDNNPAFDLTTYASGYNTFPPGFVLDNTNFPGYLMGGEIRVLSGRTLTLRDISIQFKTCAYILVEAGATLNIENCNLYSCDWWTGIIPDWSTTNSGTRTINVSNSVISYAEAAIGVLNDVEINLEHNTFINNLWHITSLGSATTPFPKNQRDCDPSSYNAPYSSQVNVSSGNLSVSDNIFINNNSFKNDHPQDDVNGYWCEYCLELYSDGNYLTCFITLYETLVATSISRNRFNNIGSIYFAGDLFYENYNLSTASPFPSVTINENKFKSVFTNHTFHGSIISSGILCSTKGAVLTEGNFLYGDYDISESVIGNGVTVQNNSFYATNSNYNGVELVGNQVNFLNNRIEGFLLGANVGGPSFNTLLSSSDIRNNTFAVNWTGLFVRGAGSSSTPSPFAIRCNKFSGNQNGLVGADYVIPQSFFIPGSSNIYEWANDFRNNSNCDVNWTGATLEYYHGNIANILNNETQLNLNKPLNPFTVWSFSFSTPNVLEYLNVADDQDVCTSKWKHAPTTAPADTINDVKKSLGQGFTIYPNPFNASFKLTTLSPLSNATVHLIDVLGREVYRENIPYLQSSASINTSSLPRGVYFVIVESKSLMTPYRIKLMKE